MNKLQRLKPYKADKPENTIRKIKDILYDLELFTIEEFLNHEEEGFFAVQAKICQDSLKGLREQFFKTNGKGASISFALASAYGELMERIQNSLIFSNYHHAILEKNNEAYTQRLAKDNIKIDFFFSPEEKMFTVSELLNSNKAILLELMKIEDNSNTIIKLNNYFPENKILCDTFYNVKKEEVEYLPVQLIRYACGSTGMCAGNEASEAIIQGICEIFERVALKQIMFNDVTPPIIPDSYFADTEILNKINTIKKLRNINITIYDCSLGIGLPILGVLFSDKTNLRYIFHLGSDPNPITALERSISEIYQGDENLKYNEYHLHKNVYKERNLSELKIKKIHYNKNISNGTGFYPSTLFSAKPTYEFKGFNYSGGISDNEDILYLKNLIFGLGHELFIKDVGYLGLPAYLVYIPGMSESHRIDEDDMNVHLEFAKHYKTLLNLKEVTDEELINFAEAFDKSYDFFWPIKASYGNIILHNANADLKKLSLDIILGLINYKIGRYEQSLKYLNIFLKGLVNSSRSSFKYIFCLRDFIFLKKENRDSSNIRSILERLYGSEITNFVFEKYSNPENVLKNLKLPSCFNCDKCLISSDCKHFEVLKIVSRLQNKYYNNMPKQLKLKEIFSNN